MLLLQRMAVEAIRCSLNEARLLTTLTVARREGRRLVLELVREQAALLGLEPAR